MKHKIIKLGAAGVKFADPGNPRVFEGYASVFGGVDSYGDTIMPGAYTETLKEENRNGRAIKMRWNHYGPVIGKWLEIKEDETGLWVRGELTPGHSVADDVAASLAHGAVDGMSIGYWVENDDVKVVGGVNQLHKIHLVEISVVEEPADTAARVDGIKSLLAGVDSIRELEKLLRDVCSLSKADAVALVARVKALSRGDHADHIDTSELKSLLQRRGKIN